MYMQKQKAIVLHKIKAFSIHSQNACVLTRHHYGGMLMFVHEHFCFADVWFRPKTNMLKLVVNEFALNVLDSVFAPE